MRRSFTYSSITPWRRWTILPNQKQLSNYWTKKHIYIYWGKVLFSAEYISQQFVRHKHVRRPIGKRVDEKISWSWDIHPVKWYGKQRVKTGQLDKIFLTPGLTMNGLKYVDLQEEKSYYIWQSTIPLNLMHDSASCSRSEILKWYLKEIHVTNWIGHVTARIGIWLSVEEAAIQYRRINHCNQKSMDERNLWRQ